MMILSAAFAVAIASSVAATSEGRCTSATEAQVLQYQERGERLFLAYVQGRVSKYEISTMRCENDIVVVVISTEHDARIGDIWTVIFDANDGSASVRRGM